MIDLQVTDGKLRLVTDDANAELIILYDAFKSAEIEDGWFDGADPFDFEEGVVVPEEHAKDVLEVIENVDLPGAFEAVMKVADEFRVATERKP